MPDTRTVQAAQELANDRREPTYICMRWYADEGDMIVILFVHEVIATDMVLVGFLPA